MTGRLPTLRSREQTCLPTLARSRLTAGTYSSESFSCGELTSEGAKLPEGELEYHPYPSSVGVTTCFPTTLPRQKQGINAAEKLGSAIIEEQQQILEVLPRSCAVFLATLSVF